MSTLITTISATRRDYEHFKSRWVNHLCGLVLLSRLKTNDHLVGKTESLRIRPKIKAQNASAAIATPFNSLLNPILVELTRRAPRASFLRWRFSAASCACVPKLVFRRIHDDDFRKNTCFSQERKTTQRHIKRLISLLTIGIKHSPQNFYCNRVKLCAKKATRVKNGAKFNHIYRESKDELPKNSHIIFTVHLPVLAFHECGIKGKLATAHRVVYPLVNPFQNVSSIPFERASKVWNSRSCLG